MPRNPVQVTGGVDTHGRTHHGAVIDANGRLLGDRQFPASAAGYRSLLAWMRSFGQVSAWESREPEPTVRAWPVT